MGIKLLGQDVINQISAGEVVEKPASIVKELVENSIDAGATAITIEIENGGIDRVCITDNGSGIKKDEVILAFTPHATSKLEKIDDLYSLSTMGFRGEALATISAVSKVTLITKTAEDDSAIMVEMRGNSEVSRSDVASVTGTKIDVKNIFYNTPARLKFLRKPKSEENDITNYVEKLMLSHPNILFKYIVDGKLIYNTMGGSIIDVIYTIYGAEVANNVVEVDYSIGDYKISGYVSKPEFGKANRTYQNLFVNSRFCNNALVSTAVGNAYENFTMKGKFPLYVLFLNLPQDELDVNVHPNKLEVKFTNTHKIFQLCQDGVFKALSDFCHVKTINEVQDDDFSVGHVSFAETVSNEGVSYSKDIGQNDGPANEFIPTQREITSQEKKISDFFSNKIDPRENKIHFEFETESSELTEISLSETEKSAFAFQCETQEICLSNFEQKAKPLQQDYTSLFSRQYKQIGKIFNTYLILEEGENVYFIDQHAAHERQKYDELISGLEKKSLEIQNLLVPYVLNVSNEENSFMQENLELFNEFGLEIYEFGDNSFKVCSVPLVIADINLKDFFATLLQNINGYAKEPKQIIKEKFMQMACKSAVKGGDDLKDIEIQALLKKLEETKVLLCPHGRPIVVEVSKKQVEKWFKRIV